MTDSDKAIALRPSYWASVSGGKDSLYMLNYKMKAGKAHGFNRGMIGRQLRFSWNKICAKEFHCVSSGRNWRIIFLRSECVQTVNKTLFGLFSH